MNPSTRSALLISLFAIASLAACAEQKKEESPAEAFVKQGNEHFKKSEFAPAAEAYRRALDVDPRRDPKLWDKLAFSYQRAGKDKEAAEALLKTIEFKTTPQERAEVYRNVASMMLESPSPMDAEKYFLAAVKEDPADDGSLVWLGEMASTRGGARDGRAAAQPDHLITAVKYYDQAITARSDELLPWVNKRIALMKLMGWEKAQKAEAESVAKLAKSKGSKDAALAQVAHHQSRIDELQAQVDAASEKITALQKMGKKLTR